MGELIGGGGGGVAGAGGGAGTIKKVLGYRLPRVIGIEI